MIRRRVDEAAAEVRQGDLLALLAANGVMVLALLAVTVSPTVLFYAALAGAPVALLAIIRATRG